MHASCTNLEENSELQNLKMKLEMDKVLGMLKLQQSSTLLDIGAGIGEWSRIFAKKIKSVCAVDYSEAMIEKARAKAAEENIDNIKFVVSSAEDYIDKNKYDIIFISGLILYLSDEGLLRLSKNIAEMSHEGTILFLREPIGTIGRYEIEDRYSPELKANYSAVYRERGDFITNFENAGFVLEKDDDMFEEGSPLNKWKETRLRVFMFRKRR